MLVSTSAGHSLLGPKIFALPPGRQPDFDLKQLMLRGSPGKTAVNKYSCFK